MKAGKLGIIAAILASTCCVGPILLMILGLGGTALGVALGQYHWPLQIGALIVLAVAWALFFKEKQKCRTAACNTEGKKLTKIILGFVTLIVTGFISLNFVGSFQPDTSAKTVEVPQNAATVTIPVQGMTCIACEVTVNRSLRNLPGVFRSNADARTGQVSVQYDPLKVSIQQVAEAINKTGFKAVIESPKP